MHFAYGEGEAMMLVAAAIAAGLAKGRSVEDISVMAALLEVIGDQLALLATVRSGCEQKRMTGVPPRLEA